MSAVNKYSQQTVKMNRRSDRAIGNSSESRRSIDGFTLFEMVAFIIVTAIIYSVAVNRFSEYPSAAERASFQSVLTQLQTGINLELMMGVRTGFVANNQDFQGINPMDLMLRPPGNYLGVYESAAADLPRRSWYFDGSTSELVYLVNSSEGVFLIRNAREIPATEIRFKVQKMYRDPISMKTVTLDELNANDNDASGGINSAVASARMSGVLLQPVVPYKWAGSSLDANELVANN